jgi:ferredoxin
MTMKVSVDESKCVGHAQCNAVGPEVYDLDDSGYCLIRNAEVPPELEQAARDGAAACPEQAITVTE